MKPQLKSIIAICAIISLFSCKKEDEFKVSGSDEKAIISFTVNTPHVEGVIDEENKTISVPLPKGTNVKKIAPVIEISANATLKPASGDTVDFTFPVTYTVFAENKTTQTYVVAIDNGPISIDPLGIDTLEIGGYILISGANFGSTEEDNTVTLVNDSLAYELDIVVANDTIIGCIVPEGVILGNYKVKVTVGGIWYAISNETIKIVVATPLITELSDSTVYAGDTIFVVGKFFGEQVADNEVYLKQGAVLTALTILEASTIEIKVKIPDGQESGDYSIKVVANGKFSYFNTFTVLDSPTKPVITNIDKTSYSLGEEMVITGANFKKDMVITNINFIPFYGGTTVVRSVAPNAEGTEIRYTLPLTFPKDSYLIVVEVDFEYSDEYGDVIQITD